VTPPDRPWIDGARPERSLRGRTAPSPGSPSPDPRSPLRILIVGGLDPSGAGVDADRDALRDLPVEAIVVVTARTDQDDRELRTIGPREPDVWRREALEAAGEGVAAIKFGLLPGVEHLRAAVSLVRALRRGRATPLPVVFDPVIRASSGGVFLDASAIEVVRREVAGEGMTLTPNLPEIAELAGIDLRDLTSSLDARVEAARSLVALGAAGVVLKGGHGTEDPVHDLVVAGDGSTRWIVRPRVPEGSIRGSGCRFASRLAAEWAMGATLEAAAEAAGDFVAEVIAREAGKRAAPRPG
jgi:hydroxymethylpyrimidine/phosphomethylpyrimidine kinase